jgi:hypothetical protein
MVALLTKKPNPFAAKDDGGAERRIFPRTEVRTFVRGRRLDHTLRALREPQLAFAMRDLSLGGLSAISPTPLDRGERISVQFPASSAPLRAGWEARGRVIRCEPSATGYRVAVEFDPLPTAA